MSKETKQFINGLITGLILGFMIACSIIGYYQEKRCKVNGYENWGITGCYSVIKEP